MKRAHIYKGTKRAITLAVLDGRYTVYEAAHVVHVSPVTVKRWLNRFGKEVLVEEAK